MDEKKGPPEPPEGLRERGAAFWRSLHGDGERFLVFDAKELQALEEACRCLDAIDALAAAVEVDGLMVKGSMGQVVVHPGVAELRMQQSSFGRLVGLLNLPEDVQAGVVARQQHAQKAVNARWVGASRARRAAANG